VVESPDVIEAFVGEYRMDHRVLRVVVLILFARGNAMHADPSIRDVEPAVVFRSPERYTTFPDVKRLPGGELLCVFRDATFPERVRHIEKDARVVGVVSKDGGRTWSAPEVIHEGTRCHNDPSVCVLDDGRVLLSWFTWVGRSEEYVETHKPPFARRVDRGEWGEYAEPGGVFLLRGTTGPLTWEKEATHVTGDSDLLVATSASILETESGALLMPVYMRRPNHPPDRAYVLRSEDGGKTWSQPTLIAEDRDGKIAMQEPALAQNREGVIVCLMRTANAEDHLYTVRSRDDGKTWTVPERTPLIGHPADLQALPDGRMLAVYGYRHDPGWGVRGCVSDDGGITWDRASEFVIADTGAHADLGYPSVCLVDDDHALVAYYMNGPETQDRWIECKRIPVDLLAASVPGSE
jgi:Neuraminidase (sialidase)